MLKYFLIGMVLLGIAACASNSITKTEKEDDDEETSSVPYPVYHHGGRLGY